MNYAAAIEKIKKDLESKDLSSEEAREALLTILHNSTKLYMEMLRVNLELKQLPTRRAGIIPPVSDDVIM
jgi:hypothetical protein